MDAAAMIIAHHCVLSMIWAACLMWALWWMMSWEAPRHQYEATKYLTQLEKHIHSRFFRTDAYYGSVLIYHAVPFMVVALLSFVVIELRKKRIKMEEGAYKENNKPGVRASIKTYPSIVRSPLGVLTTADVLFIFAILFLTTYSFVRTTYLRLEGLEQRFKFEQQIFKESLRIPSLSRLMRLQWHFFSTTSSPIDGKGELSFMIKPFGKWTTDLKDQLFTHSQQVQPLSGTSSHCPFSFKAGVEGPYGDESDFYIK